jgi:putative solute:sodium symporter small subunit
MQDGQGQQTKTADSAAAGYWPRVRRITLALLVLWLLATVIGPWFARDLAGVRWFGFPLSFWVASQGALLVYLAIIVVYVLLMDRLEQGRDLDEPAGPQALQAPVASSEPTARSEGREGRDD